MRRLVSSLAAAAIVLLLAGCSEEALVPMPDVIGKRLDVAISDIERAGFTDEVEVLGGGLLGILDESNWTVCSQDPEGGTPISAAPRVTVERSCEPDEPESTESETETEAVEEGAESASEPKGDEASASVEPDGEVEAQEEVLTVENSADLAALLASGKVDLEAHRAFAGAHEGRMIEFDGTVALVMPHGNYDTRFDFLLYPGDYDASHTTGPSFAFIDVNYSGLKLTGDDTPDSVTAGQNHHFVARVEGFVDDGGYIELAPIATTPR